MNSTWSGCSSLTSFPAIDTSAMDAQFGFGFLNTWRNCSGLTSFPSIDTSLNTRFEGTWQGCTGLSSFPALNFNAMTNGINCFDGCELNASSWGTLLINTEAGNSNNNVTWDGGLSCYEAVASSARAALIADHSWTITDGGLCPVSSSSSLSSLDRITSSDSTSSSSSEVPVVLGADDTYTITDFNKHYAFTYVGGAGTTATVSVNGIDYTVANEDIDSGNSSSSLESASYNTERFVWDSDNAQGGRHTFTLIGETITRIANGVEFQVEFDGFGSLLFTVKDFNNLSSSSSSSSVGTSSSQSAQGIGAARIGSTFKVG
jgi:hypothetical protein